VNSAAAAVGGEVFLGDDDDEVEFEGDDSDNDSQGVTGGNDRGEEMHSYN